MIDLFAYPQKVRNLIEKGNDLIEEHQIEKGLKYLESAFDTFKDPELFFYMILNWTYLPPTAENSKALFNLWFKYYRNPIDIFRNPILADAYFFSIGQSNNLYEHQYMLEIATGFYQSEQMALPHTLIEIFEQFLYLDDLREIYRDYTQSGMKDQFFQDYLDRGLDQVVTLVTMSRHLPKKEAVAINKGFLNHKQTPEVLRPVLLDNLCIIGYSKGTYLYYFGKRRRYNLENHQLVSQQDWFKKCMVGLPGYLAKLEPDPRKCQLDLILLEMVAKSFFPFVKDEFESFDAYRMTMMNYYHNPSLPTHPYIPIAFSSAKDYVNCVEGLVKVSDDGLAVDQDFPGFSFESQDFADFVAAMDDFTQFMDEAEPYEDPSQNRTIINPKGSNIIDFKKAAKKHKKKK